MASNDAVAWCEICPLIILAELQSRRKQGGDKWTAEPRKILKRPQLKQSKLQRQKMLGGVFDLGETA